MVSLGAKKMSFNSEKIDHSECEKIEHSECEKIDHSECEKIEHTPNSFCTIARQRWTAFLFMRTV